MLFVNAEVFYAINDGNWSTASNWSNTPGGPPATKAPAKGDDIYIGTYDIILDVNLMSEPGISLDIEEGGSLISATNEGVYIQAQGFLHVAGYVNIFEIDLKNDAVVTVVSTAVLSLVNWVNDGNLVNMHGDLIVSGTLTNSGVITGTGTVTAGVYNNTGNIFCYTGNPPNGTTVYGNGWIGGTPGAEYDWNTATNWCSGYVPGDSVWVIIESSTTYKNLVVTAPAQCRSLTLESGISLSITEGNSLTVADTLWNHGTLTIESSALGSGALIDNGVIYGAGVFNVELYLADSSTTSYYHHQVCAPVDNQYLGDFDVVHGSTYAHEYRPLTNSWYNIYSPYRPIPPMKGIMLSTINSSNIPNTIVFTDSLITGDQFATIEANALNLIGNPYPSPISWDQINPQTGIDNVVYIWNPITENYVSYVEGTGGNASCQYIQMGQSFFIYSTTATTFQLGNKDRVLNNEPFLKSEPVNFLKLFTQGGNGSSDELYIRLMDGATEGYDDGLEALKWPSISENDVTSFYSLSKDDDQLQINALPLLEDDGSMVIKLNFDPAVSGQYTIHSEYIESFDPDIKIYLEDRFFSPSVMYNLRDNGSYTFMTSLSSPQDRFLLHFSKEEEYSINEYNEGSISITAGRDQFTIINPDQENILKVNVYDMSGAEVAAFGPSSSSETYSVSNVNGAYIVRITTEERVYTRKLLNAY